jgi:CRISPR-associated endonuclease/helicase Cas3
MHIRTLPVYSKVADTVPDSIRNRLPDGWRLSQHQVETYRALTDPAGPDVVFNTAMTGDGKSLAGQLPSLIEGWQRSLFAMYPTNELIRDQLRQAQHTWAAWQQVPSQIRHLDSAELDHLMEPQDFSQRGDALLSTFQNSEILLTNPDIFHYVMQTFYRRQGKKGDAPDKIIGPLIELFAQFTFDEFHIFETPQTVSVLNAMLLIYEMMGRQRKRFLFQSATPSVLMQEYLERAGLTHRIISGHYLHQWHAPDPAQWRPILRGSDIYFSSGTMEEWVDQHGEDILLAFFQEHSPAAKGAVIVNSVAQAKRLVSRLRALLEPHGITIGENTGLTSRTQRTNSYQCDLLVGTSTVDVGVDFLINFLLFESRDAGSFLQRLGRLGRHTGYEREGRYYEFGDRFEAHALLPRWTLESPFSNQTEESVRLIDEMETDRETLIAAIQAAFPPATDFAQYARYWGGLQSARVIRELGQYVVRGQYEILRQRLAQRYQQTFQIHLGRKAADLNTLHKTQRQLLEEATAFRGGSYFTCGVLDVTEQGPDQIKTYDLFSLIANAELSELSEDEFWSTVDHYALERRPLERQQLVAFFRLHGFRAERTQYHIALQQDLMTWGVERFGVATVVTGVTVDTAFAHDIPTLNRINRSLEQRKLPALLCAGHDPFELKRRLRLPLLFPLYALRSRDGLNEGTIAFGREALLLDVALKYRQLDCGGQSIIL